LRWRAAPYPQSRLIYAIAHDITDQKLREEATRSLSSSFLEKPYESADLLAAVEKALSPTRDRV